MNETKTQLIQTGFTLDRLHQDGKIDNEAYTILKDRNKQAINYSQCCTELPNKMVIELSDEEMQIVSTDELIQMEKEAMQFDGFEGWIVKGKLAILK